MKRTQRLESGDIVRGVIALVLAVACGGATTGTPVVGGETHFLRKCTTTCEDDLSCIAGICTRGCVVAEASCADLAAGAACTPASVEPGAVAVCDLGCDDAADCSGLGSDYACDAGFCRAPEPASGGPVGNTGCPAFEAGVRQSTPIVTTTAAEVVGAADVAYAVADATGLYWIDRSGAVYTTRQGTVVELSPPAGDASTLTLTGFFADADGLYWGEASVPQGPVEPGPPPPPARLRAVSKLGGTPVELSASETVLYVPLAVDQGRIITRAEVGATGIYAIPVAGGEPARLMDDPSFGEPFAVRDGSLYFTQPERSMLRRVPLAGGAAQDVVSIDGSTEFELGDGTILWKHGETVFDPLTYVERLEMLNETTGCVQELPSVGLSISLAGVDAEHVYWKSFNGLAAASPGEPFEALPLVRVNLRTGVIETISSDGFQPTVVTDFLTQDDERLYFRVSGRIVAVTKP